MTEEQSLFGLTGKEIIFFKAQTVACGMCKVLKMNEAEGLDYLKKLCKSISFEEFNSETIANAYYAICQNKLLGQENLTSNLLLSLPSFSEFGRENLIQLLDAWETGGASRLEEIYWEIFYREWQDDADSYKPLEKKYLELRRAAFDKYKTTEKANNLIDQIGFGVLSKLSTEEFLERLEIRLSRPGLSQSDLAGLVTCTVACGQWESTGSSKEDAFNIIKSVCENTDLKSEKGDIVKGIYYPTQNALMAFRRDDFHKIQNEPPFSEFGSENLIRFLTAWEEGGEKSLELIFNHIFSQDWKERRPEQDIIKILSGDGETIENPVKFSTCDLMKRVRAESWYMSYLFGKEGQNWKKGIHFTTSQPDTHKMISAWNAEFPNGTSKTIYFDTNRDE